MEINEATQPLYVMATNGKRYTFFWMNRPLPENITTHTLEQAFLQANPHFPSANKMNEFCRGEWFPHDDDCFGTENEVNTALQDSSDNCSIGYGIPHYQTELSERGWCVVGTCEPGEEPYYSSSSYAGSSSSEESSSSSEFGLCQSLPFGYIPSDPKSTCFESNGKCYRCNAARRADECDEEWMWIYPYTPDKYFFTEIDCISGERKDNNRIGQCPGFPMETTPYNPEQACIAHNGKCYRCKSENSYVNCSHNWLWTGENFGTHNIGLWYEEVDCNDPFEKENNEFVVDGCVDESILRKQAAKDYYRQHEDSSIEYFVDFTKPAKKFDALGRKMSSKLSQRIVLFNKHAINEIQVQEDNYISISGIIAVSSDTLCNRLPSGEWSCSRNRYLAKRLNDASEFNSQEKCNIELGRNYGIVERNSQGEEYLVGGMTCAWPNISTYQKYEEINRTNLADEYIKIVVKYEITSKTTLGDNDHLTVKKGYVFPNGHITTSEEEGMFDKHENGHEFYNRCIKFEEISKKGQFECTIKLNAEWSQKEKDEALRNAIANELKIIEIPLIEDKVNEAQNKIDAMVYRFHKDHGVGGSSDNYTCPTN